ncbi:hypothetical protein [Streptomyces sp. NPDC006134]|uniref:hypothetical protein n=1 Tax=Streptomyces sp. NPDC006134 TaxID=3154467 RepID=UPI0033CD3556
MPARRGIGNPDEIAYCPACAPLEVTVAGLVRVVGCHCGRGPRGAGAAYGR